MSACAGQPRSHSALESCANVFVGFGLAYGVQVVTFPWFGLHPSHREHLTITVIFTAVSLVRSYALRRTFNWWRHGRG